MKKDSTKLRAELEEEINNALATYGVDPIQSAEVNHCQKGNSVSGQIIFWLVVVAFAVTGFYLFR